MPATERYLRRSGFDFEAPALWSSLPRLVVLFLALAVPLSFAGISATDVVTMEGIVADGARHMERTQEYAVSYLHSEIYSYKPPLVNWLVVGSFRLFGSESEWSLRFPFACSAVLLGLWVVVATFRSFGGPRALLAGLASLTGGIVLQKLHIAEWDIVLAAALGLAIAAACRNLASERPRALVWCGCYVGLGLGFLAKGTPALMFFGPGLVLAAVCTGKVRELFRMRHLLAVSLFVAIAGAWIIAAYAQAGWEAFEQPLAEARDKGLTWNVETLVVTLTKPFEIVVVFLPWSLLIPWTWKGDWRCDRGKRMAVSSFAFIVAGTAIFMLVPATEQRYLLPLATPFGILTGAVSAFAPRASYLTSRVVVWFVLGVSSAALLALGALAGGWLTVGGTTGGYVRWFVILGLVAGLLIGSIRLLKRRVERFPAGLILGLAVLNWFVNIAVIEPRRAEKRSLRPVAEAFEADLGAAREIWTGPVSKHFHSSSLFFYLRRPVKTFAGPENLPATGDYVVFFDNEHQALIDEPPFDYDIVQRKPHRKLEVLLTRVVD